MLRVSLLLLATAMLIGCEIVGSTDEADLNDVLRIETDAAAYTVNQSATVTVTNISNAPIFRNLCMPVALEAFADDALVATVDYPTCLALGRIDLAPGASETGTFLIEVPEWHDGSFPISNRHQYRLRMQFFRDADMQLPFPDDVASTNFFDVR